MGKLLIYGVTGTTGSRLAELAAEAGVPVIVAGRRPDAVRRVAANLGCEGRIADLEDVGKIFDDVDVVASCVGPYTRFGRPILDAAVQHGASYLDLTGEGRYVQQMFTEYDRPARNRGVTLVPSSGLGLTSSIAARAAVEALGVPVESITIAYCSRGMRSSTATLRSTVELLAAGAAVADARGIRFVSPGRRLRRTPAGLGVLFPLADPLMMHTMWPEADISGYVVSRAAPLLSPVFLVVRLMGRRAIGALRLLEGRIHGSHDPGGGFQVAVVVRGGGRTRVGTIDMDDIYELTSRAALEVAHCLLKGTEPGVRASGSIVGDPAEVVERIGARLSVT